MYLQPDFNTLDRCDSKNADPLSFVPPSRHSQRSIPAIQAIEPKRNSRFGESELFWTLYGVTAFELGASVDFDPNDEPSGALAVTFDDQISALTIEMLRDHWHKKISHDPGNSEDNYHAKDFLDAFAQVAIHEFGHQVVENAYFNTFPGMGGHARFPNTIIYSSAGAVPADAFYFDAKGIAYVRNRRVI